MLEAILCPDWEWRQFSFDLVRRLNLRRSVADLAEELDEIGYPGPGMEPE